MTPEDVVGIVGLLAMAFDRPVRPETFEAYEPALLDLEIPDPKALVLSLFRTLDRWPPPAVLRREILTRCRCMDPDEDEAWRLAVAALVKADQKDLDLFRGLPASVREAVATIGSWNILHGERGTVFAQFRDAYRTARARSTRAKLEADWTGRELNPGGRNDRAIEG